MTTTRPRAPAQMNYDIYDQLGERWYEDATTPFALLRAESRFRAPWVLKTLRALGEPSRCRVLDVGCGGGLLSNGLAREGFDVTGVDLSEPSLEVARRHDATGSVRYLKADAYALPFGDGSFDAVCALDFLEHVGDPARAVAEAGRVLRPGGLFFFYTFNRTLLSRLLVIEFVERIVKDVPPNLHLYSMFVKPEELRAMCDRAGIGVREVRGVRPDVLSSAFLRLLVSGRVPDSFRFEFTDSLAVAYLGYGVRAGPAGAA
ncbi:MAG TPA: bifunctional 2-polyprenyl-6-hydroxyphenol methylase/3-demethylubiquinol 3-O-methyltransferase UbiG [Polyangiaceae bacterium]|nr:bifunctional 2-polyprenyl-6-hydroxyphenol methylase/3-demethylubiquinol 3-O-methyltransferase UbiG [Polyangiaceae bacterium]